MRLVYFLLAFAFVIPSLQAQDAKEQKKLAKEWKKKMKQMEPLEFKELVESSESMKSQISNLTAQAEDAQNQLNAKNEENADLKDQIKSLKSQLIEAKAKPKGVPGFAVGNPNEGVVFKVQIGAFRNKDLSKYLDNNPNFSGDDNGDGSKKYTIGLFRDYWEADAFKKYMREMGVKDAWIVSYKDGARVDIKDVLEGAVTEN